MYNDIDFQHPASKQGEWLIAIVMQSFAQSKKVYCNDILSSQYSYDVFCCNKYAGYAIIQGKKYDRENEQKKWIFFV